MNAVEIEEAVSALAEQPFDLAEFPFAFLEAFGNKPTTLKRLRSGASNKSDIGGVLQTGNIHIAVCPPGEVTATLAALRASPATARAKAKFILATDGETFEAEDLTSAEGEMVSCAYPDFPDHFGFFLPLAGITTVKQVRENSFDIRATSRLNKLYVELLKDNPDWGTTARRPDMNHFMARLIFCFFAEDTDIFGGRDLFTKTVEQMSARDSANTHEVVETLFQAMNTKAEDRAGLPRWASAFPYVNGGLFSGSMEVPRFSKIARSYLIHIGGLDWTKINPDIFGSMIQAVADDEERGALGMHYTSVPNILKVLNPLFLDDLRERLEEAGDNPRKLLNLRSRMARIRVFDPACGSGNFLVIAYKEMRAIEAEIDHQRGEAHRRTGIPLTNFRGIELKSFPAEIARLALIIAEYQCDVLYRGQKEALAELLPLDAENWIVCENALRLDWLSVCPPTGSAVRHHAEDLFHTPLNQAQIDFENEGGETYICGNPPYLGGKKQTASEKEDMLHVFPKDINPKNLDYATAFMWKALGVIAAGDTFSFVATSSVNQGIHVPDFWSHVQHAGGVIRFAWLPFKWSNNAQKNAGVYCNVVGVTKGRPAKRTLFENDSQRLADNINAYLAPYRDLIVEKRLTPFPGLSRMITGNAAYDEGNLFLSSEERAEIISEEPSAARLIRKVSGTAEFTEGRSRWCLWIEDEYLMLAQQTPRVAERIHNVLKYRKSGGDVARSISHIPHRFRYQNTSTGYQMIVPQRSSVERIYYPVGLLGNEWIQTHLVYAVYDCKMTDLAVASSRLHFVWANTTSGRHGDNIRYSANLAWNTFPVPTLTDKNKADLTRCAEDVLLAREAHFPATIADLYDPEAMPADLRAAHERNDEVLERIYIGRRFKNDTERLEKLFELYTKMTVGQTKLAKRGKVRA